MFFVLEFDSRPKETEGSSALGRESMSPDLC